MAELAEIINISARKRKPVLIYCYLSASSFVEQDIKWLREVYSVKLIHFKPLPKRLLPVSFLKQLFLLAVNIRSASICICQFAGYHSLMPVVFTRIFRRSSLIIVGGTDCVSMPSINYGNLRKPLLRWFTLKSLKNCSHIVSPGKTLIECDYTYADNDFPKQGFRFFDSSIVTPVTVIYNGIDTSRFLPDRDSIRRENTFLTVCGNIDDRNFLLKGLDLFTSMAKEFPECSFTIIGRIATGFHLGIPSNVTLIDFIPHESLPSKMAEYMFYCQLSMSEGFGVALAESMACGCVPIVSKVGIMDFIVGESGFVLVKRDADMLKSVIQKALTSDTASLGIKARERVVEIFGSNKRKAELLALLQKFNKDNRK